jgi:hypothetical protein
MYIFMILILFILLISPLAILLFNNTMEYLKQVHQQVIEMANYFYVYVTMLIFLLLFLILHLNFTSIYYLYLY